MVLNNKEFHQTNKNLKPNKQTDTITNNKKIQQKVAAVAVEMGSNNGSETSLYDFDEDYETCKAVKENLTEEEKMVRELDKWG